MNAPPAALSTEWSCFLGLNSPFNNDLLFPVIQGATEIFEAASLLGVQLQSIRLSNISDKKFTRHSFQQFADNCPECEMIDLSFCNQINDEDLRFIATQLTKTKVHTLVLAHLDNITNQGLKYLNCITTLKNVDARQCISVHDCNPTDYTFILMEGGFLGYDGY